MIYRENGKIKMKCPDCKVEAKVNAEIPIGKSVFLDAECLKCGTQFDLEIQSKKKKRRVGNETTKND